MLNAPRSPWLPLICNFPTAYPGLPFTWSDGQLDAAAHLNGFGPEFRELVDANINSWSGLLCNDVAYINFRFQHIVPGGLPAKFILWAAFAVRSRGFGQHGGPAMVPVADLLNHDNDVHVSVHMYMLRAEEGSDDVEAAVPHTYDMAMLRDVRAGDEIFNSYGSHCARKWLVTYGFVPRVIEEQCVGEWLDQP